MTTITTLEALEAVEPNGLIDVNGATWTRVDGGFTRTGFTSVIAPVHFTSHLARNEVTVGTPKRAGQTYGGSGYFFRLIAQEEGNWWCAQFDAVGGFIQILSMTEDSSLLRNLVTDALDWWTPSIEALVNLLWREKRSTHRMQQDHNRTVESWREARRTAETERDQARRERDEALRTAAGSGPVIAASMAQEALHEYHSTHLDGDYEDSFNDLLDDLGLDRLPREMETVSVDVSVDGNWSSYLDDEMASRTGGNVTVDMSTTTDIEWSTSFTLDIEVERGDCACEVVERDMVRDRLVAAGVNHEALAEHWEYELSCSND